MSTDLAARRHAIFDALAAGRSAGGPAAHARNLLQTWCQAYPDDRLIVVCDTYFATDLSNLNNVHFVRIPARSFIGRMLGQWFIVPLLSLRYPTHSVVASVPVLSPLLRRRVNTVVFAHDWRHLTNPREFSRGRRIYRSIWRRSVERADATLCISRKTMRETYNLARAMRLFLCSNGCNHAASWVIESNRETVGRRVVLAFGHRSNKRPELALEGFAAALRISPDLVGIIRVIGTSTEVSDALQLRAQSLGITDRCEFPGFVSDADYQESIALAHAVLLPSTDEGFGLPVGEALYLGKFAVVTEDSGIAETFDHPRLRSTAARAEDLGAALVEVLSSTTGSNSDATLPTWEEAVATLRRTLPESRLA